MRSIHLFAATLALTLLGCGGASHPGSGGSDDACDAAMTQMTAHLAPTAESPGDHDRLDKAVAVMRKRCKADHWPSAAMQCFNDAQDGDQVSACRTRLTAAQVDRVRRDLQVALPDAPVGNAAPPPPPPPAMQPPPVAPAAPAAPGASADPCDGGE